MRLATDEVSAPPAVRQRERTCSPRERKSLSERGDRSRRERASEREKDRAREMERERERERERESERARDVAGVQRCGDRLVMPPRW